MRKTATTCLILAVLILITAISIRFKGSYEYERDIGSEWSLADKSSTISAKSEHINRFVAALEREGLSGEYDAIFLYTQNNSFDANFAALKTLQQRLREIEGMSPSSFEYQTAIQQITAQEQGEAQEMLSVFNGVWWKINYFLMWDWVGQMVFLVGITLLIVGAILFLINMD